MRLATVAKTSHRSLDALLNVVHMHCHPIASIQEGPAEPWVCMDAECIMSPWILSNRKECACMVGVKFD